MSEKLKINIFNKPFSDEIIERFLNIRENFYEGEYFYFSEKDIHKMMIGYYANNPDYDFCILIADKDGKDVARAVVGTCVNMPWAFFGFFECEDDEELFRVFSDKMLETARLLGKDELRGPVDFNGVHGWCFLEYRWNEDWWVSDSYHKPYYPGMLKAIGWEPAEEMVSFLVNKGNIDFVSLLVDDAKKKIEDAGIKAVQFTEIPKEKWIPEVADLANQIFNLSDHCYVKTDPLIMTMYIEKLLAYMMEPESFVLYYHGEKLIGYEMCSTNFIDLLCNPDGTKNHPNPSARDPYKIWGSFYTAVLPEYRNVLPAYVWFRMAAFSKERFESNLSGRRVNMRYGWTKKTLNEGATPMQKYVFLKKLIK